MPQHHRHEEENTKDEEYESNKRPRHERYIGRSFAEAVQA